MYKKKPWNLLKWNLLDWNVLERLTMFEVYIIYEHMLKYNNRKSIWMKKNNFKIG
ncbi:hypothetical protein BuS5_00183 [Desulfosarcina sp. BuS5]|nr:hypothetical protein BuS5_00183 [Desulfosarcina sp. BuS5]